MNKIIKKITIIICTFILAFSSVTSYKYYSGDVLNVNAGFVDIRHKTMEVIAVVLALLGVGISEIQDSTVDYIYNNLEDNTKAIVNNVAATVTEGYALIQETDFKELALELIKDYNLATMQLGTSVAIGMYGDNILDSFKQNYFYPYNNGTVEKIYKSGITEVARWTAIYRTFTYESNTINDMIYTLTSYDKDYNGSFYRTSGISIPVGDASFQLKIESILGLAMGSELTPTLTGGPYLVYKHTCSVLSGVHDCKNGNGTNINGLMKLANGDNVFNVSLGLALLTTGGLTLPAPLGGWDTDDANDIDVPNDYTKRILEGLGLGGLVLGGLNGRTLEDLENKGPNDVIVDQETPTPFDNVGENDTTIDIPDSGTITDTTGLAGWLGGALGALGGALTGALKALQDLIKSLANATMGQINAILALLGGLVGALTLAMSNTATNLLSGIEALLATLATTLLLPFQGFSWPDLTANWDWLKNILDFIKDLLMFIWEIIKFLMNLFRYLFNYFILLLDLLYTLFFSGLLSVLVGLSSRIKTLFSVFPSPLDMIANMTYDIAIFGLILAIVRNVLFMFRSKK